MWLKSTTDGDSWPERLPAPGPRSPILLNIDSLETLPRAPDWRSACTR